MKSLLRRLVGTAPQPLTAPAFAVPEGVRVYAFGDIHGRLDLLSQLWSKVDADVAASPPAQIVEVFLGDYIDRGPDSAAVLDVIASPPAAGRQRVALCGNHEDYVLRFLADPTQLLDWLLNGGVSTLGSYGVHANPTAFNAHEIHTAFVETFPEGHRAFLNRLPRYHVIGDYVFSHAGVRPGVPLRDQTVDDLSTIRADFLGHPGPLPFRVVHGHTPSRQPELTPWRVGIDTGAFATGRLTCAVIEGQSVRFLSTR